MVVVRAAPAAPTASGKDRSPCLSSWSTRDQRSRRNGTRQRSSASRAARLRTPADWPVDGLLVHAVAQGVGGFRVVDVWESEEAAGRFGTILQEIGITDLPEVCDAQTFVSA